MVAALDGWGQQQSSTIYFVVCVAASQRDTDTYLRVLPSPKPSFLCPFRTQERDKCVPEKQRLSMNVSTPGEKPRQFCLDFHKTEPKA